MSAEPCSLVGRASGAPSMYSHGIPNWLQTLARPTADGSIMPAKVRPVAEMLAELDEEFARGKVYEGTLRSKGLLVYGLCDYGTQAVTVDPVPHVTEVLLHELLHRRYPSWSERRVDREAHRIVSNMTRPQMQAWYARYQRVKKKRRPINADDDD